ncbi:MAG: PASTA domain-containing protein [Ruminococcaceae bacterium]|nr:PASTA domain-containing protein [Oscillospiraceae bacterium]
MPFGSEHSTMYKRMLFFTVVVVIGWVILAVRLFNLQVVNYDKYQAKVIDQLTRETKTSPERGKIFDTNMNLLVTNTTVYRVFVAPKDIRMFETEEDEKNEYEVGEVAGMIADKLVEVLEVDRAMVMEKMNKLERRDETIMRNVPPEKAEILREFIQENKLTGLLNLAADSKRYYCYGNLACHLIGFTNADGDGVYGIEATYNDYLKGTSGKYITARNAVGGDMPFKYESYVGAENGANLVTTIDMRIQYELENQIIAAYESAEATNRVCGIVMDVNTGGIIASAVYPSFDCNNPYELADYYLKELEACEYPVGSEEYNKLQSELVFRMWNNKIVSEPYEPGSTSKILTSAIALEEGVVHVDDMFTCTGQYYVPGYKEPIPCHRLVGHGEVTFARGLQQSCNPLMMNTVEKIGLDTFYKYFEALGYTKKTGVDLSGESYGIWHNKADMHSVELATYSFGQTFKATPLQQLTAICTVANGGYLVTPHVLKEMVDDDGNVIYSYESENKVQIFSEETCSTVMSILAEGVATDGGAKNAYTKGYSVAAKTGTSQKQDKWVYYDAEGNIVTINDEWVEADRPYRIGSCVAIAPADDPQIAVIIIVDEPHADGYYGSVVAAPYIADFLAVALPYLGYEPHYTEAELANMDVGITNLVGLGTADCTFYLTNRKLKFEIVGNGRIVTAHIPEGGSRLSIDSGTVYLYTGDAEPTNSIVVPDVMGQAATNANRTIVNSDLNIMIEGATNYGVGSGAVVIAQSPAAGTEVPPGTIVTITLRHMDGTD